MGFLLASDAITSTPTCLIRGGGNKLHSEIGACFPSFYDFAEAIAAGDAWVYLRYTRVGSTAARFTICIFVKKKGAEVEWELQQQEWGLYERVCTTSYVRNGLNIAGESSSTG